ncbi:hypothetical protein AB1Y20_018603 [Prymnesium parvum]|uniref:G-protein coupled receptors family 1 profile domain-containing protein n=1 Tax=Prymnesium parvum TaxID=97485 RepID=A0AB34JPL6_PRYPA
MAFSPKDAGMPIFLFVSAVCNSFFLVRVIRDFCQNSVLAGSPAVAMLLSACAELCWVVPCLVQCALIFFMGNDDLGSFSPNNRPGCDFQGFYSVLGSIAGMLSGLLIAVYTYLIAKSNGASVLGVDGIVNALPAKRTTMAIATVIFVFSLIIALLPVVALGHYKNNNEGFCYIDWYDNAQSGIMFAITLPTFITTVALFSSILAHGRWPDKTDILLMLFSFISAWALWLPASIMGFARVAFPSGYHISGGILGHAQALINPYLYGVRWRKSLLTLGCGVELTTAANGKIKSVVDEVPEVHATPVAPGAP